MTPRKRLAVAPRRVGGRLAVAVAIGAGGGASAVDAAPQTVACSSTQPQPEQLVATCALAPATAPRRHRFVARFLGSHDDTRLALQAQLDGKPLTCQAGSTTALDYEDGDVSLQCHFTLPARPQGSVLTVRLNWYHAQHDGFELTAD